MWFSKFENDKKKKLKGKLWEKIGYEYVYIFWVCD